MEHVCPMMLHMTQLLHVVYLQLDTDLHLLWNRSDV